MFEFTHAKGWIGGAALLAAALLVAFLLLRDPGVPLSAADGAYANDCCGVVELRGGRMLVGGAKSVPYRLERDEAGPYILPEHFVGTWEERGFEIDGTRAPVKLRLDTLPKPSRVVLPAATGAFSFDRKAPPRHPRLSSGSKASAA